MFSVPGRGELRLVGRLIDEEVELGPGLLIDAALLDPCIPRTWPRFEMSFKTGGADYRIVVENPNGVNRGVARIEVDGAALRGDVVPLQRDGTVHTVRVVLG